MPHRVRWRDEDGVYHVEDFYCSVDATRVACEKIAKYPDGDVTLETLGEDEGGEVEGAAVA